MAGERSKSRMPIERTAVTARNHRIVLLAALGGAALLGTGPVACLSDVTLPECVQQDTCGMIAGQTSAAGSPDVTPSAGVGGRSSGSAGAAAEAGSSALAGEGGEPADCETCVTPYKLPDPCKGEPYTATLRANGGRAPYHWAVRSTVGSWAVDPSEDDPTRATLSGTAVDPADLTIELTDQRGVVMQKLYSIAPRSACYFAYVAPDAGNDPKLRLVDPLLDAQPDRPASLAPSIMLANNHGVRDFRFSPNGRFLAYRFQDGAANPAKSHLSLVDLANKTDQLILLGEDAVTAYTWSKDARFLAVTFEQSSKTYLGGVQIPQAATPAGGVELKTLKPALSDAPAESGLFWLGTSFVAFYATVLPGLPNPQQRITPFYAALTSDGFEAPIAINDDPYLAPVTLRPADDGFFMISGKAPLTAFHTSEVASYSAEHGRDVIAPSAAFSASLDAGTLQIFRAADDDLLVPPIAKNDGCGKLLTWASGKERIACVSDISDADSGVARGEIRVFDLATGGSAASLARSTLLGSCDSRGGAPVIDPCPDSEYDYTEASSQLQPRSLSASGRWLAFTTNTQQTGPGNAFLYWADLANQPLTIKDRETLYLGAGQTTTRNVLGFSPDEQALLLQSGSILSLRWLGAPGSSITLAGDLEPPSASADCSEDFGTAPTDWCGAADRESSFVWAPDSKRIAYRRAGQLKVVDLLSNTSSESYQFEAAACDAQCSGDFAFQPQP